MADQPIPPQITVFTAVLSLDSSRIASNRVDLVCCIRLGKDEENEEHQESLLFLFMKNCYAPFLLHKFVRLSVVCEKLNTECVVILRVVKFMNSKYYLLHET